MKRDEILNIIKELAKSQGFYSRLYMELLNAQGNYPEEYEKVMQELESKNFSDPLDLVLYLEC